MSRPPIPKLDILKDKENIFPREKAPSYSSNDCPLAAAKPHKRKKCRVKKISSSATSPMQTSGLAKTRIPSSASLASTVDSDNSYISVTAPAAQEHVFTPMIELINKFPEPTMMYLCRDSDDEITPRCIAAVAALTGAAIAASALRGIPGILDLLKKKFLWGPNRAWMKHEVMEQQEIDCGAQMNVAIDLLSLAPDVVQGNVTLVKVQMIRRWHPLEADCIVNRYKKSSGENAAALGNWIKDNVFYHQCIGFFWSNGNSFRMWDYGEWFLPTSNPDGDGAILAIKLTPGRGRDILPAHVE